MEGIIKRAHEEPSLSNEDVSTVIGFVLNGFRNKCESTSEHSLRVYQQMLRVVPYLKLSHQDEVRYALAAFLHDLGKLYIPDEILKKPGALSPIEVVHMREHSELGAMAAKRLGLDESVQLGLLHHHERYDGQGYPFGLRGAEIPRMARMIAVLDAFDAMTSERSYKPKFEPEFAFRELVIGKGSQFDPMAVEIFLNCLTQPDINKPYSHGMV